VKVVFVIASVAWQSVKMPQVVNGLLRFNAMTLCFEAFAEISIICEQK
jgi:hypothetical protein